jgi:hypothetical protein
MIETYITKPQKVDAVQLLNNTESRKAVQEFLGNTFTGFLEPDPASRVNVLYTYVNAFKDDVLMSCYKAGIGDFIIREQGTNKLSVMPENTFKEKYKKVWD